MSAACDYDEYIREQWLQDIGKNPDDGFDDLKPLYQPEAVMVYCCEKCHDLEPVGDRVDSNDTCKNCGGVTWLMNQADL